MKTKPHSFSYVCLVILLYIILVPAAGAANKIIPLGDSITQGTSSGVADESFQVSYRKALYDKLKAAGYVVNDEVFVGTLFSGESVPDFDPDHEGQPGWRANEIVDGRIGFSAQGKLDEWLMAEEPNIVLLHIGTNDVANGDEDWNEIEDILVVIDDYETASGNAVWVVLSLIIDRSCLPFLPPCPKSEETTNFNNDVRDFVFSPRHIGGDKIILVNMQNDAGIDYDRWYMGGDMWDTLHPFETGYAKMADLWYSGLMQILPQADAGPGQNVNEFETVTLDASGSMDPKGGILSYQWVQTSGTPVVLSDAQAAQPTFDVPIVVPGEILTFKVTVTDADDLESTDTININVLNGSATYHSFSDVTSGHWAEEAIYKIYDAGITKGCLGNPSLYCPDKTVTRAAMVVMLGRTIHGSSFTPPQANGIFEDVPVSHWAADWTEQAYADGITNGCQKNPLKFCGERPVTRRVMAVFILRAKHGDSYTPPPATGIFTDVPANDWAEDWMEQLYNEGITLGCLGNPRYYCPDKIVTREAMAVFLVRAFEPF